jgi:uncharacterized SAM-binding protein YcdF (DUF218 family)
MSVGIFARASRSRARRWTGAAFLLALALPVSAQWMPLGAVLVPPLEARLPAPDLVGQQAVDGIVALGGQLERTVEAVRLAHRFPGAKLLISGHGEEESHEHARGMGIEASRLLIEPNSRNTFENAVFSRRLALPLPGERWLLVTAAAHMPRAVASFRKAGFEVMPWPVTADSGAHRHTNSIAKHEWLGLLTYRLLGRTGEIFPAP